MPVHHAGACPFRPPSHFKTLLLSGGLSGKHTDNFTDVEPDLNGTTGFLFSSIRDLLCVRQSARCFAHQLPCSSPTTVETVPSPPCAGEGWGSERLRNLPQTITSDDAQPDINIVQETVIFLPHLMVSLRSAHDSMQEPSPAWITHQSRGKALLCQHEGC